MPQRPALEQHRERVRSFLLDLKRPPLERQTPAESLEVLVQRAPEPGAALGWLLAYDPDPGLREAAVAMLFVAAKDPTVPRRTRRPILRAAGSVLSRAFRDPEVEDDVKYFIGPTLSLCGVEIDPDTYQNTFRDHEGVRRRMFAAHVREKAATPEAVEDCLEGADRPNLERFSQGMERARAAVEANPPFAAMLLVTLAVIARERGLAVDPAPALADAAATRTGVARWILRTAGELPAMGPVGDEARRLAAELATAGIAEEVPDAGTFERGMFSIVDGMGSRQVALLFHRGSSRDCSTLMLNDEVGIKEALCVYEEGREVLRTFGEHPWITVARCDLALAREVVADALAVHERTGRPVPSRFLLQRHFLGPEPIAPAERTPDLSAYRLDEVEVGPELVARSRNLAHRPGFNNLYCASDRAYAFLRDRVERQGEEPLALSLTGREMAGFIDQVAAEERPQLLRRIAANLEIEALAGRAGRAINRRLARLWLGLQHHVVPFAQVPFVLELTRIGIENVLENVLQGYETQAEADADMMEPDEDEIPY